MGKSDKKPTESSDKAPKSADRTNGPKAGAGDRKPVRRERGPDKPASHTGAKTSREYKKGELKATGKENWDSQRGRHTDRAEKAARAEVKAATGKDAKIASQKPGEKVEHHHHAGVSESKKVGLNPNVAGEKERLTAVHSSKSDKVFAREGDKPNFDPKSDKGRVTHHTQASRIDKAEQARAAKELGVKGDKPKLPNTDAGRKAMVDASGTGKWRWPATGDQAERAKQDWTKRIEPKGPKLDNQGRVVPEKAVPKTDVPRAPVKAADTLGKLNRAAGVAGRLGGVLSLFGMYKEYRQIVGEEKPESLREGEKVQLYRPVRDLPIMKEPTGYSVEKKDGKIIYRGPGGEVVPKDKALRSTKWNYAGEA